MVFPSSYTVQFLKCPGFILFEGGESTAESFSVVHCGDGLGKVRSRNEKHKKCIYNLHNTT
jgi:hypothetical protein